YAIFVGYELNRDGFTSGFKGGVESAQQHFAGGNIEMMEEVGDEDVVVAVAQIGIEGAPGEWGEAVGDTGLLRILLGDFKHGVPVKRSHMNARIVFGNDDAVHAVAGGNVENTNRRGRVATNDLR